MSEWNMVRLGDILRFLPKAKVKAGDGIDHGKYKFFTSSNIQSKYLDFYTCEEFALIFGTGGNASVHFCDEKFASSTDCLVATAGEKTVLKIIFLYLKNNIYLLQEGFKGAGLKHISKDYICNIVIPLPPLEIQQTIVDILYKASGLIQLRKAQIEKLDLLVKSQFIEMFGDPVTNPMGWPVKPISEFTTFLTSGSRGWSCYFADIGEMFLTIKNVKDSRISLENIQYVHAPETQEAVRTKVQEGDLLISITADLGRTGVVTKEIADFGAYINQHLSLVRLDKSKVNPLYVSYLLETPAGRCQFESKNQSAVKAGLNFNAINSLMLMIPPIDTQNRFIFFVQQVDKSKFEMQQGLKKLQTNYNAIMQKCFSGELFS